MVLRKEIERYLILIQTLESSLQIAKELKKLPLSFFNATRDHLDLLKEELDRIERLQSQTMAPEKETIPDKVDENYLKQEKQEEKIVVEETVLKEETVLPEVEVQEIHYSEKQISVGFLADEIDKKIHMDLSSCLTLNDRFRFQRDLFNGNVEQMNQTLKKLNDFNSMEEVVSYLSNLDWDWENDSAQAFIEMLEKRFG